MELTKARYFLPSELLRILKSRSVYVRPKKIKVPVSVGVVIDIQGFHNFFFWKDCCNCEYQCIKGFYGHVRRFSLETTNYDKKYLCLECANTVDKAKEIFDLKFNSIPTKPPLPQGYIRGY